MTTIQQMRMNIFILRLLLVIAVVFIITVMACAAGNSKVDSSSIELTQTQMWFIGGVCTVAIAVLLILRKHENAITSLQSRDAPVTIGVCNANIELIKSELSHGNERFVKIEKYLDDIKEEHGISLTRHEETLNLLKDIKESVVGKVINVDGNTEN